MKSTLLSTVAAVVLLTAGSAYAYPGQPQQPVSSEELSVEANGVIANQNMDAVVGGDSVHMTGADVKSTTGSITNTYNGSGVHTVQGQTGLNDAGTNGANLAVQYDSSSDANMNANLSGSVDVALANQELTSSVTGNNVDLYAVAYGSMDPHSHGTSSSASSSTGNIQVAQNSGVAILTVQNQTGLNDAAANGMNMAVQVK